MAVANSPARAAQAAPPPADLHGTLLLLNSNLVTGIEWLAFALQKLENFTQTPPAWATTLLEAIHDKTAYTVQLIALGSDLKTILGTLSKELKNMSTDLQNLQAADTALQTSITNLTTAVGGLSTLLDSAVTALKAAIANNSTAGLPAITADLAAAKTNLDKLTAQVQATQARDTLPASSGTTTGSATPTASPTPTPAPAPAPATPPATP
jgi:hypothetical protein